MARQKITPDPTCLLEAHEMGLVPPTRLICFSCRLRSSFACRESGIRPISSRKSVPWSESSKSPSFPFRRAPVNAPSSYPKSSLSSRSFGSAAQLMATKGPSR